MPPWIIFTIGVLAGALTTASWVPQLFRSWKTRSARDFSWGYLFLFACGISAWEVYGILRRDPAIILANLVTLLLVLGVVWIKSREVR